MDRVVALLAIVLLLVAGLFLVQLNPAYGRYWYFHLPNFILAALMYTLLGRVLLSLFVDAESTNYIWRFFCRFTDPIVGLVSLVTPKATVPLVVWLFGFVWLFWLRVMFDYSMRVMGLAPDIT